MTALGEYMRALLAKAPSKDNWPGIGDEISYTLKSMAEISVTEIPIGTNSDPGYGVGTNDGRRESSEGIENIAVVYDEAKKRQKRQILISTIWSCTAAWEPPHLPRNKTKMPKSPTILLALVYLHVYSPCQEARWLRLSLGRSGLECQAESALDIFQGFVDASSIDNGFRMPTLY
ncbi:uncharacterized protein N7529_002943 [Penicillium soppii]|uniref:uncharacterized protein n=1 Tax=Penicillium soppii TaxID=69789 RepID=UPI002548B474|nr:uncharacterized protein N7529_002943 [Penicillium soppii]KAJ5874513.1 hypothetical protein N7529_002943 [Penicillium soppii]